VLYPRRESDSSAPPRRESISFPVADGVNRTPTKLQISGKGAPLLRRSCSDERRWRQRQHLYTGQGMAQQAGGGGSRVGRAGVGVDMGK
jgi:hypothetical protein